MPCPTNRTASASHDQSALTWFSVWHRLQVTVVVLMLLAVLSPVVAIGQLPGTWAYRHLERFRDGQDAYIVDSATYIVVGGNLTNDSITTALKTRDHGFTWDIIDDTHWPPHLGLVTDLEMVSDSEGYYAGMNGLVKHTTDTGDSWTHILLSGIGGYRHYRGMDFKDVNVGIIVGGNQRSDAQLHDSLQTIVRTTDAGVTWTYPRDIQGPWLRDVAFVPGTSTVVAVGDSNVILRSTDDGLTWSQVASPLTSNRVLNAVTFISGWEGFAVGGMPGSWWSADSMTTMLHTIDAGATWTVQIDRSGPMLNDVSFYSNANGFAVGDHNLVLATWSGGTEWTQQTIAAAQQDDLEMYSVHFEDPHLGIITGRLGKCLFYTDATEYAPVILPQPVTLLDPNSVQLKAKVNANGHPTTVHFEYGTSQALGNVVNLNPGMTDGYNLNGFSTTLAGLQPMQRYYYKVVANSSIGTTEAWGQFRTTTQPQPNFDFEFWSPMLSRDVPDNWFSLDDEPFPGMWSVHQSTEKVHGVFSLKLSNTDSAYAFLRSGTSPTQEKFPVTEPYQSLNGYLRLHSEGNDTLRARVEMFQSGNLIGTGMQHFTGSTVSLQPFAVTVLYPNPNLVPDSARIEFQFLNGASPSAPGASYVILDALSFDGLILHEPEAAVATIQSLMVYPNPSQGLVNVQFCLAKPAEARIVVLDLLGHPLRSQSYNSLGMQTHAIDLHGLPAGQYLLQITAGGQRFTRRIIHTQ